MEDCLRVLDLELVEAALEALSASSAASAFFCFPRRLGWVPVGVCRVGFLFVEAPRALDRLLERPLWFFGCLELLVLASSLRSLAISDLSDLVSVATLFVISSWSCSGGGALSLSMIIAAVSVAVLVNRLLSRAFNATVRWWSASWAR